MKNRETIYQKALYVYIFMQPFVDMLTSLSVRFGLSNVTLGIVIRALFIGCMGAYVLFLYKGPQKLLLRLMVIITTLYGVAYLANTVSINGLSVLVENTKLFVKTYYFIYALMGIYALYRQYGLQVSDKMLTVVFCIYTISIFLSAITNTSFHTYYFEEIGFCGWFYAGNEIGAIIAILSSIALFYGFTHPKYLWIGIMGLVAFSGTYIGTKVPYFAILGAGILLLLFWTVKYIRKKSKDKSLKIAKYVALLLCIFVLYQTGSPVQQNGDLASDRYQDIIESLESTGPTDPEETHPNGTPVANSLAKRLFLLANLLLSNRLALVENVLSRYAQGSTMEKLLGIGYEFTINGEISSDVIEMDFVSLIVKHGVLGTAIYMAPILYFAILCMIKLFRQLKHFWDMEPALVYTYSILIGLGCAFLAGHVLVAPAVSIYLAICIVKLYGYLTEREASHLQLKGSAEGAET